MGFSRSRVSVFLIAAVGAVVGLGGVASAAGLLSAPGRGVEMPAAELVPGASDGPVALMLELEGKPSALVAEPRAETRAAVNADLQADVSSEAQSEGLLDSELFRVGVVYNGVGVIADAGEAEELAALDGVKAVHELPLHEPTNSASVPYIGGDTTWSAAGGNHTGEGVKVGIIDSGIDWAHVNFGGPGSDTAYAEGSAPAANPPTTEQHNPGFEVVLDGDQIYPSAKVVGGFDFVGDGYDGTPESVAVSDPNPLDCAASEGGGHGTHVAGTAAGNGVKANGETFDGDLSAPLPSDLRIGPGVAPDAELYALRVFGCGGPTAFVLPAVDWAMDPNRDGSTDDHLDVLNLSLGSNFGIPGEPLAEAVTNAAEAGVSVAVSAGNSGNTSTITGSPGSSPRAITVANMVTGMHLDGIDVSGASVGSGANGTRDVTLSSNYAWEDMDTPISAPLAWNNDTGCAPLDPAVYGGKIAMLSFPPGTCGSAARATAAQNAGAVGLILVENMTAYDFSIAGNAAIPAVLAIEPLRSQLIAAAESGGATITFDKALLGQGYSTAGAGTLNDSSSRGPGAGHVLKPDIAAPGTDIRSAKSGSGDYFVDYTGTSMAAPHVAGAMALLSEAKPSWNAEELKAAAMNTASPDVDVAGGLAGAGGRYPPQRAGTGVIDVPAAIETELLAMAAPGSGEISLRFGSLQVPVGAPFQREEEVAIVNKGSSPEVVDASFIPRDAPPGVSFDVLGGDDLAVPAGGSATVTVRIAVPDPSELRNTREATLSAGQTALDGQTFARTFDVDASGLLRLEPESSAPELSVPVHANVRPAADMGAEDEVWMEPGDVSGEVQLSGTPIDTGDSVGDWESRVSAFELQARSPRMALGPGVPEYARFADIRSVGVAEQGGVLRFGIETDAPLPQPASYGTFEISVDTDDDGDTEFTVFNHRWPAANKGSLDVFATGYRNDAGTQFITQPTLGGGPGTGEFGSRAMVIPISLATLGLNGAGTDFDYTVRSYASRVGGTVDVVGPLSWDHASPAVDVAPGAYLPDVPGVLPFEFDAAAAEAGGTEGMLLLHHLNAGEEQAEIVRIGVNAPPVVDAGGPYSGAEGSTIGLDASGSTDPDDDELTVSWDLDGDGTYETNGATPSVALADGPGIRTVGLRVADGLSTPAEQDVNVAIGNVVPTASVAAIGNPPTGVRVGATDPSAPDRSAGFTYEVDVGADGSIEKTVDGGAAVAVPLALPAGSTVVRVTATDKDGGVSAARQITLVRPQPPAVRCIVPKLKGKTRKEARRALLAANCTLGKVRKPKGKKGKRAKGKRVVAKQTVAPGRELPEDSAVGIKLKVAKKGKRGQR